MDKLRILALHGYHGSAAILQSQLRPLAEASSPLADFVYVDAPSLANGDFGWWHASGKEGSIRYQGWSRTRDWLKQLCATKGPFDGVFGFSQGAALTALLVGLCAAEPRRPEAQLHFDFAMLVGGFASGDARHAPLYEALRGHELPTLHLIGRSDSIVSSTRSHALARRFESPLILEHDGGHVIAATPPIRRDVHAFLERMAQRRRLRREGRAGRTATAVAQAARRPTSASPSQSSPPWQSSPHYSQSPSYSSSPSHSPSRLSSPSPSPSSYSSSPSQGPSRLSSPSPSSPSYSSSRSQSGSIALPAGPLDVPLWSGRAHPALRIHWPTGARAASLPALLVFRGGAYATDHGSGEGTAEWAAQHGLIGVEVEYATRATRQSYPAGYADAARAMRLVRKHAAEWGIDPARVGVVGYSAGGHLASLLSTQPALGPANGRVDRVGRKKIALGDRQGPSGVIYLRSGRRRVGSSEVATAESDDGRTRSSTVGRR